MTGIFQILLAGQGSPTILADYLVVAGGGGGGGSKEKSERKDSGDFY